MYGDISRVSDPVWYWPDPAPTSQDKRDQFFFSFRIQEKNGSNPSVVEIFRLQIKGLERVMRVITEPLRSLSIKTNSYTYMTCMHRKISLVKLDLDQFLISDVKPTWPVASIEPLPPYSIQQNNPSLNRIWISWNRMNALVKTNKHFYHRYNPIGKHFHTFLCIRTIIIL